MNAKKREQEETTRKRYIYKAHFPIHQTERLLTKTYPTATYYLLGCRFILYHIRRMYGTCMYNQPECSREK